MAQKSSDEMFIAGWELSGETDEAFTGLCGLHGETDEAFTSLCGRSENPIEHLLLTSPPPGGPTRHQDARKEGEW